MKRRNPRDNKTYRDKQQNLYQRAKKLGTPCHLCGQKINYNLPATHKYSFTADHVIPLNKGGKLLGILKPAHRSCNSKKRDKTTNTTQPTPTKPLNNW